MLKLSLTTSLFLLIFPVFLNAQSIELDKMLGEEYAKMVSAQMGIYEDHPKSEFIRSVGNRLLDHLPDNKFEFEFHIVPEMAPNVFALPGGYVFITTGLLPLIETEDELVCIMAHEIIHAQNRHSIKQLKKSILPRLLEVPGNLIGVLNKDLGAIFNTPIQTSNALLMASYVEGVKLAAAAGYDPNAMIPVLSRMSEAIEKATGQQEAKSYFNDHPYTPDRVKTIEQSTVRLLWTKQKGESIKTLSERSKNLLNEELTAVINSRGIYEQLDVGEEVKVVKQYPYLVD